MQSLLIDAVLEHVGCLLNAPLQKMRVRLGACKTGISLPVILYYWSFQGDTSVVVLIVLCFGVEFLCCLSRMYVFIFLVQFGKLSDRLLENCCSLGLHHVFMV